MIEQRCDERLEVPIPLCPEPFVWAHLSIPRWTSPGQFDQLRSFVLAYLDTARPALIERRVSTLYQRVVCDRALPEQVAAEFEVTVDVVEDAVEEFGE